MLCSTSGAGLVRSAQRARRKGWPSGPWGRDQSDHSWSIHGGGAVDLADRHVMTIAREEPCGRRRLRFHAGPPGALAW